MLSQPSTSTSSSQCRRLRLQTRSGQHPQLLGKHAPSVTLTRSISDSLHRTLTAATIVLSVNFWLLPIINPSYFVFIPRQIFKLWVPQVWRSVTAFLITGPKLGLILDPYFLFTYCKALEVDSGRFSQPGDLFVALVFICSVILVRSVFSRCHFFLSFTHTHFTPPISARPAKNIAEAVPGGRANYRCTVS